MKNKITIIGSGAMATATSKVIFDSGYENITIYGIDKGELSDLEKGINTNYFPKSIQLPNFHVEENIKHALENAEYVILAVPSKFMDKVLEQVLDNLNSKVIIINISKGFYPGTHMSIHRGIKSITKNHSLVRGVVSLIGPSHAEEIVQSMPTIVAVVDTDKKILKETQKLFNNDYFKTYMQTEVKGAEVGASYKNVLAIASGIASGLGYGINTMAAILTRGIAEMLRFNKAMKGKDKTIMGLTGIGDLIVTATSDLSRNYTFGKTIGLKGIDAVDETKTVEGLTALKVIYEIGKEKNIYLPIVNSLNDIIFNKGKVQEVITILWNKMASFE